MVCFEPIDCFLPADFDKDGKRRLIFNPNTVNDYVFSSDYNKKFLPTDDFFQNHHIVLDSDFKHNGLIKGYIIKVPCGKCDGCRNDYARRWSARCYHEGLMHNHFKDCCFVTLTFNNNMLYKRKNPWSVDKLGFSQWLKRFREQIRDKYGRSGIRFFCCGEYGLSTKNGVRKGRPHYHLLLYGFNFPDKTIMRGPCYPGKLQPKVIQDRIVYNYHSDFLQECWTPAGSDESFGFHTISDLNQFTCSYVARYVMKKSGKDEFPNREPVFTNCSRDPGIGASFFDRHYKSMFANNFIRIGTDFITDIPRYYVDRLKNTDIELYNRYKLDRFRDLLNNFKDDSNSEQLQAKRELLKRKLDMYHRNYEELPDLHNI